MANNLNYEDYKNLYLENINPEDSNLKIYEKELQDIATQGYNERSQDYYKTGTISDFLTSALGGGIEGYTFGAARFGERDFNKMNQAQRMGRGFGSALSYITPGKGPFAVLGKGLNKLTGRLATKSTQNLIKKVQANKNITKHVKNNTDKKFLDNEIQKSLFKNETVLKTIDRFGISDKQMEQAQKMLVQNMDGALRASFKKQTGKNLSKSLSREVSENIARELRKPGLHINNFEDWVSAGIRQKFPFVGKFASQYMGMAAQDVAVFTAHTALTSSIGKMFYNDNMTLGDFGYQMGINTVQAGLFPGVRHFWKRGGQATLKQGFEILKNKRTLNKALDQFDYSAMAKRKNGDRNLRGLLRIMAGGADLNVVNTTRFAAKKWTIKTGPNKGKGYTNNQIINDFDNMPLDDVVDLLGQYKKYTANQFGNFTKGYLRDFMYSIPRMVTGSMVMNIDMFMGNRLEGLTMPELIQHMAIGAFMTKSRGLWGRDTEPTQWAKDFSKYQNTFNYLNMDTKNLESLLDVYSSDRDFKDLISLTTGQTAIGQAIKDVVNPKDKVINSHLKEGDDTYDTLPYNVYKKVQEAVDLSVAMESNNIFDAEKLMDINVKNLPAKRIQEIYDGLASLKVGNDRLVDMPLGSFYETTMRELGEANKMYYLRMIDEIAEKTNLPIDVKKSSDDEGNVFFTGELEFSPLNIPGDIDFTLNGDYHNTLIELYNVIDVFQDLGIAKAKKESVPITFVESGSGKDKKITVKEFPNKINIAKVVDDVAESYMAKIVKNVHGDNSALRVENFLGMNKYFRTIIEGRMSENLSLGYRLANSKGKAEEGLTNEEMTFVDLAKRFFSVNSDYTKDYGDGVHVGKMVKYAPKVVPDDAQVYDKLQGNSKNAEDQNLAKLQIQLNSIFDFMSAGNTQKTAPAEFSNTLTKSEADQFINSYTKLKLILPRGLYNNESFQQKLTDYVLQRTLEGQKFNEESLALITAAKDIGVFDLADKSILTPQTLMQALKNQGYTELEITPALERYKKVYDKLIRNKSINEGLDLPAEELPITNIDNINYLYEMTFEGNVDKVLAKLEDAKESLSDIDPKINDLRDNAGAIIETINTFTQTALSLRDQGVTAEPGIVKKFHETVDNLIESIQNKITGNPELNDLITELRTNVDMVSETYKRNEFMELSNSPIVEDIGNISERIINYEYNLNKKIQRSLTNFISMANNPTTQGRALMTYDNIQKELALALNQTDYNTVTLQELINDYKNSRSMYDLNNILEKHAQIAMSEKTINRYSSDLDEAISDMKALVKKNAAHGANDSPINILRRFGLTDVDNPNKIDPDFVGLTVESLKIYDHEMKKYVRDNFSQDQKDVIFDNGGFNLTDTQRKTVLDAIRDTKAENFENYVINSINKKYTAENVDAEINAFRDNAGNLLRYISSLDEPITTFTIKENSIVVEDNVPGRRTLAGINSPLMKSLDLDVVQINESIVFNGRKTTINSQNFSKDKIERELSKLVHVDQKLAEKIFGADPEDISTVLMDETTGKQKERLFAVLDMSDAAPIALPLSADNIDKINKGYDAWKANKINILEKKGIEFKNNFEYATSNIGKGSKNVAIKMLLMNLDSSLPKEFDKHFSDEAYKSVDRTKNFNELAQNMLKKTKQTVNKNYDYINDEYTTLLRRLKNVDNEVKESFAKFDLNDGGRKLNVLVTGDEDPLLNFEKGDFSQSDLITNRGTVLKKLNDIIADKSNPQKSKYAEQFKKEIENNKVIESLHSSSIDGAVIINNEDVRKVMGYLFGDINSNGFKANTAYSEGFMSENTKGLVTKGYFHAPGTFADLPNLKDVDLIIGESAAKSFFNIENNVERGVFKLQPGLSLYDNLAQRKSGNTDGIIEIPLSAIGLGHKSKPGDKVLVSNSLNDFMSETIIDKLRDYSGFKTNIKNLIERKYDISKITEPELVLTLMREIEDQTGLDFSDGSYGYAMNLLKAGMRTDDPAVKSSVSSLFKNKIFDVIRRNTTDRGADTYLIPDLKNELESSVFTTLENVKKLGDDPSVLSRVQTTFGDVNLPYHFGQKQIRSIDEVDFIINYEGRDVRIRFRKQGMEVTDQLFDVVNDKKYITTFDGNELKATSIQSNKQLMSHLNGLQKYITEIIKNESLDQTVLTIKTLQDMLNGNYKIKNNSEGAPLIETLKTNSILSLRDNYNLGIGVATIAIPKKSLDVGFNRINKFLSPDMGNHTQINNYDLRVMHQRDFDGDHGYHYFGLPSDFINQSIKYSGVVKDYIQAPRYNFESNIFGMDSDGKFGNISNDVGFTSLKNNINTNQFVIGETISLKNTLNWASNIGIDLKLGDETVSFLNTESIDMINKGLESPEAQNEIAKAHINQNAVDYNKRTDITDDLTRATLFGDVSEQAIANLAKVGINLEGVLTNKSKFKTVGVSNSTESLFNQAIVKTILRTLTKPKAVLTDPFNEGGQFTPTDWYIGTIYSDLQNFLRSPNQYIAEQLIKQFSGNKAMMQQIMKTFYTTGRDADFVLDNEKIERFFYGKPQKIVNSIISFKNVGNLVSPDFYSAKGVEKAIDFDNGGYALQRLYKNQILKDSDFYGDINTEKFGIDIPLLTSRKNGLLNSLAMYKALYPDSDPVKTFFSEEKADDIFDIKTIDSRQFGKDVSFENINMRSAVYHLLNKEASSLTKEIGQMEGSQYKINEYEHKILASRLRDIESGMQILEKLAYKGLVKKDGDANIFFNKTPRKQQFVGKTVNVYRFKGKIAPNDILSQDFSQLDFVGSFNPKITKTYNMDSGYTYIELKKPLVRTYLGSNESVHNAASFQTINDLLIVDNIAKTTREKEVLYDDLARVINQINDNYSFARKYAKANPQEKREAYNYSSFGDQVKLEEFYKKHKAIDDNGELKFEDGEPGVDLTLLLLKPRLVPGAYIGGPIQDLPYSYSNPRLQSAVYKFLSDKGVIKGDDMPSRLEGYFKIKNLRVDIINGSAPSNEYLQDLTNTYKLSANNTLSDVLEHGRTVNFIDAMFSRYGFYDPGMRNSFVPENFESGVYEKAGLKNRKYKFYVNKRKPGNGC